jgi:chaperonin GroEL (HSP60 family)
MELHSKIVEGMVIDQSYISPYMVTNAETNEAELENPFVLIADKKLANIQEMLPCLQSVTQSGAPLLIIAEDLQDDIHKREPFARLFPICRYWFARRLCQRVKNKSVSEVSFTYSR